MKIVTNSSVCTALNSSWSDYNSGTMLAGPEQRCQSRDLGKGKSSSVVYEQVLNKLIINFHDFVVSIKLSSSPCLILQLSLLGYMYMYKSLLQEF